jgi:hypothetical protein
MMGVLEFVLLTLRGRMLRKGEALWFICLVGWCEFKPKIDAFVV